YDPLPDGVRDDEDNRDPWRGLLRRQRRRCPARDDEIDVGADEIRRKLRQSLVLSRRPEVLDDEVLSFDIPELTEPLNEEAGIFSRAGTAGEVADAGDLVGRLGVGDQEK